MNQSFLDYLSVLHSVASNWQTASAVCSYSYRGESETPAVIYSESSSHPVLSVCHLFFGACPGIFYPIPRLIHAKTNSTSLRDGACFMQSVNASSLVHGKKST